MSPQPDARRCITRGAMAALPALAIAITAADRAGAAITPAAPAADPDVPCRVIDEGSSSWHFVKPGESVDIELEMIVQYLCEDCPDDLPPPEGPISWAVTGARLGQITSSSGRIEAGDLRSYEVAGAHFAGTDAFTYRAGDRKGTDILRLDIEHPECEIRSEHEVHVEIDVDDWEVSIRADYEGLTGRTGVYGQAYWHGSFTVVEGDRLEGRGTYYHEDSGECFYYYVRNGFRIGGAIEEGYFRFEFLDYETLHEAGPLVPEDLRCVVKAAAQGVDLLAGVARNAARFDEAVVRVPPEGEFSADSTYSTFRIAVLRR